MKIYFLCLVFCLKLYFFENFVGCDQGASTLIYKHGSSSKKPHFATLKPHGPHYKHKPTISKNLVEILAFAHEKWRQYGKFQKTQTKKTTKSPKPYDHGYAGGYGGKPTTRPPYWKKNKGDKNYRPILPEILPTVKQPRPVKPYVSDVPSYAKPHVEIITPDPPQCGCNKKKTSYRHGYDGKNYIPGHTEILTPDSTILESTTEEPQTASRSCSSSSSSTSSSASSCHSSSKPPTETTTVTATETSAKPATETSTEPPTEPTESSTEPSTESSSESSTELSSESSTECSSESSELSSESSTESSSESSTELSSESSSEPPTSSTETTGPTQTESSLLPLSSSTSTQTSTSCATSTRKK